MANETTEPKTKKRRGPSKFLLLRQTTIGELRAQAETGVPGATEAFNTLPVLLVDCEAATLRGLDRAETQDGLHRIVCVRKTFTVTTESVKTRKPVK